MADMGQVSDVPFTVASEVEVKVAPDFTVQVEIWGRVFGGEQMHLLGTINYRLEDGELISDEEFRVSLGEFKTVMEEEFRSNG